MKKLNINQNCSTKESRVAEGYGNSRFQVAVKWNNSKLQNKNSQINTNFDVEEAEVRIKIQEGQKN